MRDRMETETRCYYCGYPLPAGAAQCPECGDAAKVPRPVLALHRTAAATWVLLGMVTLLLSIQGPIYYWAFHSQRASGQLGMPLHDWLDLAVDLLGIFLGCATTGWSILAMRRTHTIPTFPFMLR